MTRLCAHRKVHLEVSEGLQEPRHLLVTPVYRALEWMPRTPLYQVRSQSTDGTLKTCDNLVTVDKSYLERNRDE